jgi:hypothetical protein
MLIPFSRKEKYPNPLTLTKNMPICMLGLPSRIRNWYVGNIGFPSKCAQGLILVQWKPLPTRDHRLDGGFEGDVLDAMQHLAVTTPRPLPTRRRPEITNQPRAHLPLRRSLNGCHIWDAVSILVYFHVSSLRLTRLMKQLRISEVIPRPKSLRMRLPSDTQVQPATHRCSLDQALQFHSLELTVSFRKAPGCQLSVFNPFRDDSNFFSFCTSHQ